MRRARVAGETAAALQRLITDALTELARGGDAAEAERRAKAITALVRAEREVAERAAAPELLSAEEDEEVRRAELRRRLARFVEAACAGAADPVLERIALAGSPE